MDIKEYYQGQRYRNGSVEWREKEYFPGRVRYLTRMLKFQFSGKVLDIGCGDGAMLKEIVRQFPGTEVYGTDISKHGCSIARKNGIDARVADLDEGIPFDDGIFDYVIAHEVIEHLLDPDSFLEECERVLKSRGYAIITTPNLLAWYQRLLCLFGIVPTFYELSMRNRKIGLGFLNRILKNTQPVGHIRVFNKKGLVDIMKMYGFEVIAIKTSPIDYPFSPGIKHIYNFFDKFFSLFPSLGSNLIMIARKKK